MDTTIRHTILKTDTGQTYNLPIFLEQIINDILTQIYEATTKKNNEVKYCNTSL